MLALTIYEEGLCSCGHPLILSHDELSEGWYNVLKPTCQSCAAQERATTGNKGNPYVPSPGEKVYTIFDAEGKAAAEARRAARVAPADVLFQSPE
jgi:hypothetical protein